MAQAQGANARIGIVKETTWGTTPGVSAGDLKVIPFESESLNSAQERLQNPHMSGSRNYGAGVLGQVEAGGDLTVRMNPTAHGWLWRALLGAPTTSGTGPYTHVWKVPTTLPSYTIEKWFSDITKGFAFTGMRLGSLSLKMSPAGFLEVTCSFQGKNASTLTSSLDAAPTTYTDNPFDLAAANTQLTEGGTTLATATGLELTIDNELDGSVYTLANAGARGALPAGKCRVSGRLTAFFEDLALYNKAVNSTESSLLLVLQHGTGTGAAGAEQLSIAVDELLYGRNVPQVGASGGVAVELPWEGYYGDDADATSVKVTLKNSVASYA